MLLIVANLVFIGVFLHWAFWANFRPISGINGVYAQAGPMYWLKCVVFYGLVTLQKVNEQK